MNENDWVRTRTICLETLNDSDIYPIQQRLEKLLGIKRLHIQPKKQAVSVHYDMSLINYEEIVSELENKGFIYKKNLWSRIKRVWAKFVDQTAQENSQHRPAACCNRPPHAHKKKGQ